MPRIVAARDKRRSLSPLFQQLILLTLSAPVGYAACGGRAVDQNATDDAGASANDASKAESDASIDSGPWDHMVCGSGGGRPVAARDCAASVERQIPCEIPFVTNNNLPEADCRKYCQFQADVIATCYTYVDSITGAGALYCGGGPCEGRKPQGFVPSVASERTPLAEYFARMSELEHASIAAFAILREELDLLGADRALLERCDAAREDEIQHASVTGELAMAFGSTSGLRVSTVPPPETRTILQIAIENAVEGCVRETFAAVLARHRGLRATHEGVREVMASIGEDETRHAELSWDIFDFLNERLTSDEREQVKIAMNRAILDLQRELEDSVDPRLERVVGLPGRTTARAIFAGLQEQLWAA